MSDASTIVRNPGSSEMVLGDEMLMRKEKCVQKRNKLRMARDDDADDGAVLFFHGVGIYGCVGGCMTFGALCRGCHSVASHRCFALSCELGTY